MRTANFAAVAIALGLCAVLSVAGRPMAGHSGSRIGLHKWHATPNPCEANISLAVENALAAVGDVGKAIKACGDHNGTSCAADVADAASALASAAADVSQAVTACGGKGSACATVLLDLTHDLAKAAAEISTTVADCENPNTRGACVMELIEVASTVGSIIKAIEGAVKAC